jgi:hypothetical protein
MKRTLLGIIILLCFRSSGIAESNWIIYLRRAGPIQIGMSLPEVRKAIADPSARLVWIEQEDPAGVNGCSYLESRALPSKVGIMFNKQRVVRVDIDEGSKFKTASGIGIGDTEERIQAVYRGQIRVEPHHYTDGHYLIYTPTDKADRGYRMTFETEAGRVSTFRIGLVAAVALVEGCA